MLACSERAAEAVEVHEAFERWLPGNSPRLAAKFPRYPAPEGSLEPAMGPDEIRLEFLSQSVQFATAYAAVGRYADYVAKFDDALARLTPTNESMAEGGRHGDHGYAWLMHAAAVWKGHSRSSAYARPAARSSRPSLARSHERVSDVGV